MRLVDTKADSRDHVAEITARIDYPTNPPTAGLHFGAAAEDGIYAETPPDITVVHSHEHGRVAIWFKPGLPRAHRDGLHALVEDDFDKMLLIPRAEMPFDVAATAWNAEPEPPEPAAYWAVRASAARPTTRCAPSAMSTAARAPRRSPPP